MACIHRASSSLQHKGLALSEAGDQIAELQLELASVQSECEAKQAQLEKTLDLVAQLKQVGDGLGGGRGHERFCVSAEGFGCLCI